MGQAIDVLDRMPETRHLYGIDPMVTKVVDSLRYGAERVDIIDTLLDIIEKNKFHKCPYCGYETP